MIAIAVSCIIGLSLIACAKIKYVDKAVQDKFVKRFETVEINLSKINADKVDSLLEDVRVLKNMNNLRARPK